MLVLELLAAHMVGDYILQSDDMAKRKLSDWRVRAVHVLAYTLPFIFVVGWKAATYEGALLFLLANGVVHFIIDSRRWASGEAWPPKPILVDQTLHLVQLAVLGRLLIP